MKISTWLLAAALALACAVPAFAADQIGYAVGNGNLNTVPASPQTPLPVSSPPSSVTGSVTPATIGTSSAQVLAAGSRRLVTIDNESATATIACAFGATAAINTAGSYTIAPGYTRVWDKYPVPADAVNCIASAASTPATVEAN